MLARKISSVFQNLFARKHLYQTNIFSGTTLRDEVRIAWNAYRGNIDNFFAGPWLRPFEKKFARVIRTPDSISFATGRMAFYAILKALGIGEGDEVIIPAFTCVVVPNAIIYAGARPIYADIETERFSLDPAKLVGVITPRTKAIMAQHTFGIPCFLEEIQKVAEGKGIPVIEDCAHSLGGSLNGKPLGSIGAASFFSMDHTKIVSTISGGMATSPDPGLLQAIRKIQETSGFISHNHFNRLIRGFIYVFVIRSSDLLLGKISASAHDAHWMGQMVC